MKQDDYLEAYRNIHPDFGIILVSRLSVRASWGTRCIYSGLLYDPKLHYNHRSILPSEIVIEFDDDDVDTNRKYADEVVKRLKENNITYSKWYTGGRSTHVHCLVNMRNCRNPVLLKRTFMRYMTQGIAEPDIRLAANNHLIRSEYGLHEKSGNHKKLISKSKDYPTVSEIPQPVWDRYTKYQLSNVRRQTTVALNDMSGVAEHPGFQYLIKTHEFKEAGDGKERALFMIIHVMKPKFKDDKAGLIKYCQEWYKYSGGYKMTDTEVANKVHYHWSRNFTPGFRYLRDLLRSIGKEDMMEK